MKTELVKFNYRRASYDEYTVERRGEGFGFCIEHVAIKDWNCVRELQQWCYSGDSHELTRDELQQLYDEIGEVLKEGGA